MANKKFKLILLSHDLTKKVELSLTSRKVRAALLGLGFCFLATNVVAGLVASFVLHSRENQALQTENIQLREHLTTLETRLAGVNEQLSVLGETDKLLRMMSNLPVLDADVRKAGVGGGIDETTTEPNPAELTYSVWSLDRIQREIEIQKTSFEEIRAQLTENAVILDHTPTLRPVDGGYISSGFGIRRDPYTKRMAAHQGIDICEPSGTPVMAAASGRVIFAARYYNYGKFVIVDHGNGCQTAYGHLSRIDVRAGQLVTKGQDIGKVGMTGRATAPHLHYEVRQDGQAVDPSDYFFEDAAASPLALAASR
jgi:murein DD-endopeptidase MepM/ murein hydrolase activator NlpD